MENNESNDTNAGKRLSWPIIAGFIAVIVLILVGLFLPPISLGSRLSRGGQEIAGVTPEPTADVAVPLPDGVNLSVSNEATVSVVNVPATELASAAAALPVSIFPVGSAYVLSYEGDAPAGQIAIPLPPDAAPLQTLDIYGWDGQTWDHVPGQFDDAGGQAVLAEGPLPRAVILARTAAPERPAIGVEVSPEETVSPGVAPLTTEISVGTLMLGENGSLSGELADKPEGNADVFLRVSNRAAIVDQANLSALLNNPAIQDAQINSVVGQAEAEGYAGVHLDYQGVPVAQEAAFTEFAAKLADALAARGLSFAISLGSPTAAINTWDTGGQDWAALGRLADIVYIDMPLDPAAYGPDGLATQLLGWATGQISRTKINAVHTAGTINKVGDVYTELPVSQALANLGQLRLVSEAAEVEPGGAIEVELDGTAEPLEWDGSSLAYKYTFEQAGQPQTVWFIGESALNNRLLVARDYNLRGVTVRGMGELGSGETYAAMFNHFVGDGEPPQPGGAAIAWTVRDESDSVVASDTGSELSFDWTAADNPGTYVVEASLVLGDTVSPLGEVEVVVAGAEVVEVEATEEATPAETEDTTSPTQPAATPVAAGNIGEPGEAVAVVNVPANVRTGPGISYGTIAGGAAAGARVQLIGRNDRGDWFNIVLPSGERGWILNSLVTVNTGFNPNSLEVVEAPPPEAPAAGAPAPAPSVSGGAPPVAPVGNVGNFELGGQAAGCRPAHAIRRYDLDQEAAQVEPRRFAAGVAGLINEAHASGLQDPAQHSRPAEPEQHQLRGVY
jgi:spore germination protein